MSKFRKSAKGQSCTLESWLQWEGGHDPETVVLAHAPCELRGMGHKPAKSDIRAAFLCSQCHDLQDGRRRISGRNWQDLSYLFCVSSKSTLRDILWGIAIEETQLRWIAMGLLPND